MKNKNQWYSVGFESSIDGLYQFSQMGDSVREETGIHFSIHSGNKLNII